MSQFKNQLAPIDGAAPSEVQEVQIAALWAQIERFERADFAMLDLAFELAGASLEVRAAIQQRCGEAKKEYDAK